ncbi:MAG: hypothetical protein FJY99_13475 [Candidatus Sericytochromatia bacterium]|nr:hypothetical protein [Candidatus Tanganyikabacteria bacterium]
MREGPRKPPSWMAELFFEAAVVPAAAVPGLPAAERAAEPAFTRADLLGLSAHGPEPPRNFAAYKVLMEDLFNPMRNRALALMAKEPVFASAREVWRKGQGQANAAIVQGLVPFVIRSLEQAYGFTSPPIDYKAAAGFLGLYDMRHHRILVSPTLFNTSLKDFLDTVIHEEMHAFQAELILMLNVQRKGRVLSAPERAIAQYWRNEEPKYRSAMAAGSAMSPETKARYRMIGQEYHAWTTAHFLASRLAGA